MSEFDIIKILSVFIDRNKHPYQLPNSFIYGWECDYWTMTANGETREYEIKISRQDYLKDAEKEKHRNNNGANYFYYVCPEGLIKKDEVDKRYGLIYIMDGRWLSIVKKPKQLNKNVFLNWKMLANKMYGKWHSMWKQKYIDKEISRDEYWEGFNIELENFFKLKHFNP